MNYAYKMPRPWTGEVKYAPKIKDSERVVDVAAISPETPANANSMANTLKNTGGVIVKNPKAALEAAETAYKSKGLTSTMKEAARTYKKNRAESSKRVDKYSGNGDRASH